MNPTSLRSLAVLSLASVFFAGSAFGQFHPPAAPGGAFEEPPTLDAAAILLPEFVQGPHYRVRGPVPTYAGHNQYTIDSDFGIFEADGNAQFVQRIHEIAAIAKLREVSRTDQYKEALKNAAKSPVAMAKNLAEDPVKTISGVPKGLWKMVNRVGQSVKEVGEKRERNPYEDNSARDMIGFSKTKRDLAVDLGVDPYSSNETLQKDLNGIAWAAFGGQMTMTIALAPVGGAAGAVITGINVSDTASQALRDKSPVDLRRLHLEKLLALGIAREDVVAFLNNPAFSPTHAMLFVEAVEKLRGVAGLENFVEIATDASDEIDALFFQRTAQVLASVHATTPLAALDNFNGFPIAFAKDGNVVVALEWDYACWTERAANFVKTLNGSTHDGWAITGHRFVLTGVASPRVKDELTALHVGLTEKALPGPLR